MSPSLDLRAALDRWYAQVRAPDPEALFAMLHPEVVFESPVVHTPQRGREVAFRYLASAEQVLGGPDFHYVGEWLNADGAVLEFATVRDGIAINGIDLIRFDADGRIRHFKVMVRPLKAVNLLHQLMAAQLEALGAAGRQ
jgi:hypothetical protein